MKFSETFLPECIAKITLILFKQTNKQKQLEDDELNMISVSVIPGALEAKAVAL